MERPPLCALLSSSQAAAACTVRGYHSTLQRLQSDALKSVIALKSSTRRTATAAAANQGNKNAAAPMQPQQQQHKARWLWCGIIAAFTVLLVLCVKKVRSLDSFTSAGTAGLSFTANVFGSNISLAERTPGWIYFLLLMAAGFGLFISEEALVVWVGATIARSLIWNSTRTAFFNSLSSKTSYILSTVLWVYWGVCISDLVPFYAGRLAAQSGSGDSFRAKLGINKEKLDGLSTSVRRYGNLIGFVERFSVGARNPTAFVAGASGIAPSKFFAGVCLGGLVTLPVQMSLGFVLRERPAAAIAGVASFVGIWTIFPYLVAAALSIFYFTGNPQQQQQHTNNTGDQTVDD